MNTALASVKAKMEEAIASFSLLDGVRRVLVAFSGGADSALLLTLLSEMPQLQVEAAHFNHGIRGEEAKRDEHFCTRFCADRAIPLHIGAAPEGAILGAAGESPEEAARRYRYDFLDALDRKYGYDAVATAHQADDNLETLLFRLVRGTTLRGLCAIPPKRDKFIRPLLLCSAEEIRRACDEASIPYVTDSTNADPHYTRNYLRREVVPRLKVLNPSLTDTVSSSLRFLSDDQRCLSEAAASFSLADGRTALAALPDALLHRVLRSEAERFGAAPQSSHLRQTAKLLRSSRRHASLCLPGGVFLCDGEKVAYRTSLPQSSSYEFPLHYGYHRIDASTGVYLFKNTHGARKVINQLKNIYKLSTEASFSSAIMEKGATLRNRRPGDVYFCGGMHRKVKKLLQTTPLSSERRGALPFLVSDDEILWIPFFPPSDRLSSENNDFILLYVTEPRAPKGTL